MWYTARPIQKPTIIPSGRSGPPDSSASARTAFNLYSVEWTPKEIRWYVNGKHYFTFANERLTQPTADYKQWPFDKPFHLVLNLAVGGKWGGARGVDPSSLASTN